MRETVLYLPDAGWNVLVPVRVYIPWEEGIARATLRYLTEGNLPAAVQSLGLVALLPAETAILGLTIRDGLARVDFSSEFLTFPAERERLVLNGLVHTLSEFPTVHEVELLVEGQKPDLPGKTSVAEPLNRDFGLNLEISGGIDSFEGTERISLYYLMPTSAQSLFVPVTRVIKIPDNRIAAIVEELLLGPAPGGTLFSAIPRGLSLNHVEVKGNKVTIRFTGKVASGGGQLAADQFMSQLALTLTEITGITEVEVLADGSAPDFGPGIQFPQAFGRPDKWNLITQ